jgi:hypothetical protein
MHPLKHGTKHEWDNSRWRGQAVWLPPRPVIVTTSFLPSARPSALQEALFRVSIRSRLDLDPPKGPQR